MATNNEYSGWLATESGYSEVSIYEGEDGRLYSSTECVVDQELLIDTDAELAELQGWSELVDGPAHVYRNHELAVVVLDSVSASRPWGR